MYSRILVPVDGSETAALGLTEAIRLAKAAGARLRLVHVVNELIPMPYAAGYDLARLIDTLRVGGEALLAESRAAARAAGVEAETVLVEAIGGQAGAAIVRQASEWPAELIVMGTHGHRGLRRIVLGSDAEYVVRRTPVPVLLIRTRAPAGELAVSVRSD